MHRSKDIRDRRIRFGLICLITFGVATAWGGLELDENQVRVNSNISRASPAVVKIQESLIAPDANRLLNGLSFQQDALATYNGWQYAAYYNNRGSVRHVCLARRRLPDCNWETLEFGDYAQTTSDEHNVISLGISPLDGTIHLSFDAHAGPLHYRRSIPDLASDPGSYEWSTSQFAPVENSLGGIRLSSITYPRFLPTPEGKLQYEIRIGTSGNGDSYLYEYDGSSGTWTELGKYIDGTVSHVNGYLNGIQYDESGRLHVTWCWRETPDFVTNHDLMYAYSDDYGRTWNNNDGIQVAVTGQTSISMSSPGIVVWPIPQRSGLLNQEAQTLDHQGRIHVLMRDSLAGSLSYVHYYRDIDGAWHRTELVEPLPVGPLGPRAKIAVDSSDNVYALLPNLVIAASSAVSDYTDWAVIDQADDGRFAREPLYDFARLRSDGVLSTFNVSADSSDLRVLDYSFDEF